MMDCFSKRFSVVLFFQNNFCFEQELKNLLMILIFTFLLAYFGNAHFSRFVNVVMT